VANRSNRFGKAVQRRESLRASAFFDVDAFLGLAQDDGKRTVPSEFRVFPAGEFPTVKGNFIFSKRSAESVLSWYKSRGLRLMGDFEHMTDEPSSGRPPVISPASITNMIPEARPNEAGEPELWVTDVKWTDRARTMLEKGEYAYFSPTFLHDPETNEVLALLRIALTNDPAIDALEPLVAATSAASEGHQNPDDGAQTMADEIKCATCAANEAHLKTLSAQNDEMAAKLKAAAQEHEELCQKHKALSEALASLGKSFEDWASEESEEHEQMDASPITSPAELGGEETQPTAQLAARIVKRLRAFARDVKALTGQKTSAAALGTLTAWKDGSGELVTLKAGIEKAQKETMAAQFKALADQACTDGKLSPAERKVLETKDTSFALEFLTAKLGSTTAPVVNRTETLPPSEATGAALATLGAGVQQAAGQFFGGKVSVEALAKAKADYDEHLRRNTAGARQ
jgi:phage I-like protein